MVPAEGKVVAVLIKGGTHYITQQQWEYSRWSFHTADGAASILAVLCGVIYVLYGKAGFR